MSCSFETVNQNNSGEWTVRIEGLDGTHSLSEFLQTWFDRASRDGPCFHRKDVGKNSHKAVNRLPTGRKAFKPISYVLFVHASRSI